MIAITKPKTRLRGARLQAVVIHDPVTLALAALALSTHLGQSALVLPGGASELRRCFDELLRAVGASGLPYSSASLRGAGAVADFSHARSSLTDVMFHGRWESVSSVTHYLQMGLAALATAQLPEDAALRCCRLAALLPSVLAAVRDGISNR